MRISILLVSYNQIEYIDQCLDGILLQEFDSQMELIIADDFSSDGTIERLKERLKETAFEVKFLIADKNLGLGKNYLRGIAACRGEFVSFLEGDDYWTDPQRLRKHVDFLERNAQCPMSFNPFAIYNQKTGSLTIPDLNAKPEVNFYSSKKLIQYNVIGNFSACIFRKTALESVSGQWFEHNITDWFLGIYLAEKHPVAQLNEVMSVYRINPRGLWSKYSKEEQCDKKSKLTFTYDFLLGYRFSNEFLAYRLTARIKKKRDDWKANSPKKLGQVVSKVISHGLILRFSIAIAYMVPKKMIKRNEKIYNIF
jgi:glycosyltransferase involved in cell wall biosynthesis